MPSVTRAVFFDFGGTLYDYASLRLAEIESLVDLARWVGVNVEPQEIWDAHRNAMRRVFYKYRPRRFYLHRDLFRDALIGMLEDFGARADKEHLNRYRALQWKRHARDFALREGVDRTLTVLRDKGLHLALVSNIDEDQLEHLLAIAKLQAHFDTVLSSEEAGSCKPDSAIFNETLRRAGCEPGEALFVGDSILQDVAGANRAGLRSVLLWHDSNREPPETDSPPGHVIREVSELLALV